ncbi:MAG: hypothetical protein O7B99_11305 [Planctomycetota bacterium]|nr:hypothetical protein [Planctomycetota bacterium]
MAPLERRDAPLRVAILGWLLLVLGLLGPILLTGNLAIFQLLGVGPDVTLPDAVRRMWPTVVWLLAQAFLGLACLRGWRWGLLAYFVVCGGILLLFVIGSFLSMRDGQGSYFITVFLYGLPYLIALVVLMTSSARSFFAGGGEIGA